MEQLPPPRAGMFADGARIRGAQRAVVGFFHEEAAVFRDQHDQGDRDHAPLGDRYRG